MSGETDDFGQYASPPCFLHELQDGFAPTESDPQAAADIRRWRKAERERLIAARLAVPADTRAARASSSASATPFSASPPSTPSRTTSPWTSCSPRKPEPQRPSRRV